MVNAHMACISANALIWCKKKKDVLSHYEFRKAIALALLAPEEFYDRFEPEEESAASSNTSLSKNMQTGRPAKRRIIVIKRSESTKPVGACRVNDRTLHPEHGVWKYRLNRSVPHSPDDNFLEQRNNYLRCALIDGLIGIHRSKGMWLHAAHAKFPSAFGTLKSSTRNKM